MFRFLNFQYGISVALKLRLKSSGLFVVMVTTYYMGREVVIEFSFVEQCQVSKLASRIRLEKRAMIVEQCQVSKLASRIRLEKRAMRYQDCETQRKQKKQL